MVSFYALICIVALISTVFWSVELDKFNKEQAKKKGLEGLKLKLKKIFKPKQVEEQTQNLKYTSQQINTFLYSSIIVLLISIVGIGIHSPPEETHNKIINESVVAENIITVDSQEESQNVIVNELGTNVTVDNTTIDDNDNVNTIDTKKETLKEATGSQQTISTSNIPEYSGQPYVAINNNVPYFTDSDLTTKSYEYYSNLDNFGRCGVAVANIGKDIMPTIDRGDIGSVKPTGWHTIKYDNVSGKYLYNRCHLIGYQLSGENANIKNLITGTCYLNVEGMLPFENMVDDYIEETNNHVLYRVTPIFEGNNLLASGILIEAKSVEDNGAGILFNVYCYNVQPGIDIDYSTGESSSKSNSTSTTNNSSSSTGTITPVVEESKSETPPPSTTNEVSQTYILNNNTKKFHEEGCGSASRISQKNKGTYTGTRDELINKGYSPCGNCDP